MLRNNNPNDETSGITPFKESKNRFVGKQGDCICFLGFETSRNAGKKSYVLLRQCACSHIRTVGWFEKINFLNFKNPRGLKNFVCYKYIAYPENLSPIKK